jgi:CheY-like chemotaxis protein
MSKIAAPSELDRLRPAPVILIVEDEVLVRAVIADHLREEGFKVIETANAREAMEVIASREVVDLVFTDHNMPGGMDGRSLVAWLEHHRPGLPTILTSGALAPVVGEDADRSRFVAKPYQVLDVERRIRQLLQPGRLPPTEC